MEVKLEELISLSKSILTQLKINSTEGKSIFVSAISTDTEMIIFNNGLEDADKFRDIVCDLQNHLITYKDIIL